MEPLIDLRGRSALVTGGSRGIGRATALMLARAGADVGIAYRDRTEDAAAVTEECRARGVRAWAQSGDLTDAGDVEALVARCGREFGRLDIVVGNHGIWPEAEVPVADMTDEQWHRTVSVNLESMFYLCRAAAPRLRDGGRVVLVSSTAAQRGEAWHADYAATKGALVALVKSLCVELAPRGVTVNAVAPGWVQTEMSAGALSGARGEETASAIPLGRVASPDEVAGPIAFLCSGLASHVTGEVLNVNGGAVLVG